MDYVYVCRAGENEELRYSLRSLTTNAPKANVWLVGNKPKWFTGNFISVKDTHNKFQNIKNCMLAIAESDNISNDFISMHDDFFILKKINAFQIYHGGLLEKKIEEYSILDRSSPYTRLLFNTYKRLKKLGYKDPIDYDIHVPIIMNKDNLKQALKHPYLERSIYGNMFNIGGQEVTDVKIYNGGHLIERSYDYLNNDFEFVSTTDGSFSKLYNDLLKDMFPVPSIYE